MNFCLIAAKEVDWERLDRFDDRIVFQTREWINFLADSQRATPVVASLCDSGKVVGYFTGLVFSRMGIRILGSPFPGWTTQYMGFNLLPHVRREEALRALVTFAFRDLKCLHLEVSDLFASKQDGESLGFSCSLTHTFTTDLMQSEETIFRGMERTCRQCIRKAEEHGVRVEEAGDENFPEDYYEQLRHVFRRQGLVPTYGLDRVKHLIRHMLPTGHLLLLRARDPQGRCIATSIYVALNKVAVYWGNASFRHSQQLRPNELLNWYAIRYWKNRGLQVFDWGGGAGYGRYKGKYGGQALSYANFRKSRFGFVGILRTGAMNLFKLERPLRGPMQGRGSPPMPAACYAHH
jgi:hypothetical protein